MSAKESRSGRCTKLPASKQEPFLFFFIFSYPLKKAIKEALIAGWHSHGSLISVV